MRNYFNFSSLGKTRLINSVLLLTVSFHLVLGILPSFNLDAEVNRGNYIQNNDLIAFSANLNFTVSKSDNPNKVTQFKKNYTPIRYLDIQQINEKDYHSYHTYPDAGYTLHQIILATDHQLRSPPAII